MSKPNETTNNKIELPQVTDVLVHNAAQYLAKTAHHYHVGVCKTMLIDAKIVLEYAKHVYEVWLNEQVQSAGHVLYFLPREKP